MVLAQAEAENVVELRSRLGQLDMNNHMGFGLLMKQPVVSMTFDVS